MRNVYSWFKNEKGVTAIEYGVILMLIIMIFVGTIGSTGEALAAFWAKIASSF